MPTPTTTITDSKFNALKVKLRELFELDKSDLDFGIYRIIAAKNKEVTEFLDRQLKDVVRGTLAAHGAGAADQVQAELDKAIEQARALGADPETLPKVKDLRARLESAGGAASADLEADIYNHLLAFFGRYYDEGDFISQRRYKGDTYAIPYSGEEVTLHWANKDQYYIKSGEWHKDYRFRVGDKTVRFKLVEATQEVGNNKEADDAKRRYILVAESPVEESASELALRFEFRAPKPADVECAAAGAVAIFGGDYAKPSNPKKGDEREQFCADAEKRASAAMPDAWRALVGVVVPKGQPGSTATDDKPARTLLGKHLDHFTARNTFDYFIHKDLGGFLRRELDFYLKNEVVRLDDLESLPPEHLQRVQGKVKAIRTVASRLIAFLASLEDFQKKMWLKKKFVLNTNWIVTVDRIPAALRDVVAANQDQWVEWERLGFKPEPSGHGDLFGGARWGTRTYLDACDKLPVDTKYFPHMFVASLLASEEVRAGPSTLDRAATGVLIHADNFHALQLLSTAYRGTVQCIYIDPPYNAKTSEIPYKNTFKHSAWLSLISSRIAAAQGLLNDGSVFVCAIDENEQEALGVMFAEAYPMHNRTCVSVVHNPRGIQGDAFSYTHEFAYFVFSDSARIGKRSLDEEKSKPLMKTGGESDRFSAKNCFYPILVREGKVIDFGECPEDDDWHPGQAVIKRPDGIEEIWPISVSDRQERKWRYSQTSVKEIKAKLEVRKGRDGLPVIYLAKDEESYRTVWTDALFNAAEYGSTLIKNMFEVEPEFSFPKSLWTVYHSLIAGNVSDGDIALDFFGGSGTTAHAVLALNRTDQSARQFLVVEGARYFSTVLKPRVTKAAFCPDWKDGKAQTLEKGLSSLVKYFALESYEDALNNLPAPSGSLLDGRTTAEKDALIIYALDLELGPRLLDLDAFRDPWGYTIKAQLAGDAEIKRHRVDLVETFNYLIGLKVHAYGPLERYSADFERAAHADSLGRIKIMGRLRRDPNGPFVFQRVEGELNDGNATRVLVVWRKLTDDPEKDAAALDAWMARHRETTRERTEHRDYHLIYINGPVTLPQPTAEIRTVFPTEETFKIKMFEDTDSASSTGGANG